MNCQKAGDLLSAYIEGEVMGRQGAALESHLAGCAGCHEELETLRSALVLLAAPKSLAHPEGLLEEFKAKYLPEAQTAPAPRWGVRLPVLPKFEWPSLGRVMVPMGGMMAAAAALLVVLHSHPGIMSPGRPDAGQTQTRVAVLPTPTNANVVETTAKVAPSLASPASGPQHGLEMAAAPMAGTRMRTSHSSRRMATASPRLHKRSRHASLGLVPANRRLRAKKQRVSNYVIAANHPLMPALTEAELTDAVTRHESAVPSAELLWKDQDGQAVASRRRAPAESSEDGYAEASCKNLATGEMKSVAIGPPTVPPAAGPVPNDPSAGK